MPVDTRRLPVPENSKSPLCYVAQLEHVETLLVNSEGKRSDGRTVDQVRPVFLRTGVITKAKGSAYIELNKTKVICAVYGPREVNRREDFSMRGQLVVEYQPATFCRQLRGHHQTADVDKDTARNIEAALLPAIMLDKFPKARMDVFITVLEDDGSCLSASLTCASVALADAGLEMYDLVIGCSLRQHGSHQLVDPASSEEYKQHQASSTSEGGEGELVVGYMPSLDQLASLTQQGNMDLSTLNKAIKLCIDTCQRLYPVIQDCLVKAVEQRMQNT